jgi:hypothetical protein
VRWVVGGVGGWAVGAGWGVSYSGGGSGGVYCERGVVGEFMVGDLVGFGVGWRGGAEEG